MTRGPERLRLDAALAEADEAVVRSNGEAEWLSATYRLRDVSRALRVAANSGLGIGGRTGPAMFKAMRRSADHLDERIALFNEGRAALGSAADTISRVREQRDRLDTDPETAALPDPGEFRDDPEWDDEKRLREQSRHTAAASAFADREALREQRAREIAEEFDRRYDEPIAVMKKIHGIPDPEPETVSGDGGAGGGGRGSVPGPRGAGGIPGTGGLLGGGHTGGPCRHPRGPLPWTARARVHGDGAGRGRGAVGSLFERHGGGRRPRRGRSPGRSGQERRAARPHRRCAGGRPAAAGDRSTTDPTSGRPQPLGGLRHPRPRLRGRGAGLGTAGGTRWRGGRLVRRSDPDGPRHGRRIRGAQRHPRGGRSCRREPHHRASTRPRRVRGP